MVFSLREVGEDTNALGNNVFWDGRAIIEDGGISS
jgi:hypothetical protein